MENTIINYPIIEMTDWYDEKRIKKLKTIQKKNQITVKSYVSKLKSFHTKIGKYFDISVIIGKEVHIIPDIDIHRRDYLKKKSSTRKASRKRNRNRGLMDSLNADILKFKFNDFIIKEAYRDYCYITVKNKSSETFKVYYDEILIKKEDKK